MKKKQTNLFKVKKYLLSWDIVWVQTVLCILIYLVSKALRQVEGTFHLFIGWQISFGLLPKHTR